MLSSSPGISSNKDSSTDKAFAYHRNLFMHLGSAFELPKNKKSDKSDDFYYVFSDCQNIWVRTLLFSETSLQSKVKLLISGFLERFLISKKFWTFGTSLKNWMFPIKSINTFAFIKGREKEIFNSLKYKQMTYFSWSILNLLIVGSYSQQEHLNS